MALRNTYPSDLARNYRALPSTAQELADHLLGTLRGGQTLARKLEFFKRGSYVPSVGYGPYAGQMDIHSCEARFTLCRCGRRFGKSLAMAWECAFKAQFPRQRIWIVAPEYSLTDRVFEVVWEVLVGQLGMTPATGSSLPNRFLRLDNQTIIEGKSLDNPRSLLGTAINLLIIDEVQLCDKALWTSRLLPAVTGATVNGYVKMIGTPEPGHWTNDLFDGVERVQNTPDADPNWKVFWAPSWINSTLYPGGENDPQIQIARGEMTRDEFLEQYAARPRRPRLQVYREFDAAIHVRHDIEYDPQAEVFIGLDPGSANGYGVVALQIDIERRRVNVIDEYEQPGVTAHDVWLDLARRPWWGNIKLGVIDDAALNDRYWWVRRTISAPDGTSITGPSLIVIPAFKQRTETRVSTPAGVNVVKQYLRDPGVWDAYLERRKLELCTAMYGCQWDELDVTRQHLLMGQAEDTPDAETLESATSLYISHHCTRLIETIGKYQYPETRGEGRNLSEIPAKKDDHLCDALRYLLWSLDPLGKKYGARRAPDAPDKKDAETLVSHRPRSSSEVMGV